jgi:hypothetical protein
VKPARIKLFKIILTIILSAIVLFTLLTGAYVYYFPREKITQILIANLKKTLNRKISFGKINMSFSGLVVRDFKLYDGLDDESPLLAKADEFVMRFSIIPLITNKKLDLKYAGFRNCELNLVFDSDGVSNIEKLIEQIQKDPESNFSTSVSSVRLDKVKFNLKNPPAYLKPLTGNYIITTNIYFKEKTLELDDCNLKLPEERGSLTANLILSRSGDFSITGRADLERISLNWVYQWGNPNLPYNMVTGKVTDIKITEKSIEGSVKASSTLKNSSDIVIVDGSCRVDLKNKTVHIFDVGGKISSSKFILNQLIFTFSGNLLNFKASNIDANISHIRPVIPDILPVKLYGFVKGGLTYDRGIMNGSITFSDAGYDQKSRLVSDINTTVNISGNTFKNANVPMKILGNNCQVSFASTEASLKKIYLNISSEKFEIKSGLFKDDGTNYRFAPPVAVSGRLDIKELIKENYRISNMHADYSITGSNIIFNAISCRLFGGGISGNGTVSFEKPGAPKTSIQIKFEGLKVQELLSSDKEFDKRFFGTASGFAKLDFIASENFIGTLSGKTEINIDNGKLVNTGVQKSLGIWLADLKYKLNDLEFNKIYGNMDIRGNNIIINSFIFNSPNIRLNVKGVIDKKLVATPLNFSLEFNNIFLQDIPTPAVKLGLNKYLKGSWYIIPFVINGDLTNAKSMKKM